jgi:hypothetical protein
MDISPKKRGRPLSATALASATVNYQALAWQVKQRIEVAEQQGRKLKITDAVRAEMQASVKWRNEHGLPTRANRVDSKFRTAYTEVRKLLSRWEKTGKG